MNRKGVACPTPTKVAYRRHIDAKLALMKLNWQDKEGHHETRAYRCACRRWHLTSREERMWSQ